MTLKADDRRRLREEKALAIVRAVRPEQTIAAKAGPSHTKIEGNVADPTGVVYVAYCADRIKIGYSTDIAARIASMASNAPFPVTLLMTVTGTEATEALFHEVFAAQRIHLEWFRFEDELWWFVFSSLCDDGNDRLLEAMLEYHRTPRDPGL